MINYNALPATIATSFNNEMTNNNNVYYSSTNNTDEARLYADLDTSLTTLETSLAIDHSVLDEIEREAKGFKMNLEDKEEIKMRIDWLQRLDTAKQKVKKVHTLDDVEELLKLIAVCQTSPLKTKLKKQLDNVAESLPSESEDHVKESVEDSLMLQAFDQVGNIFINLGKTGREYVITQTIQHYGKKASVQIVQEKTTDLEQRVHSLLDFQDEIELIQAIDDLPIDLLNTFSKDRKEKIAERLIETKKWTGLATLERMILHWDYILTEQEREKWECENRTNILEGRAPSTLNPKFMSTVMNTECQWSSPLKTDTK